MNKSRKLDQLVNHVEELLAQLPGELSPEVSRLRERVEDNIFDAWTNVSRQRAQARADLGEAAESLRVYVKNNPWLLAGAAAALAGLLTFATRAFLRRQSEALQRSDT